MAFIMDGLGAEAYDRDYSDADLLRRIGGYFRPYAVRMGFVSLTILATAVVDAALPVLISQGVDRLAGVSGGVELWAQSRGLLATIVLAAAVSWGLNFLRQLYIARAVGDVVLDLRRDAVTAVLDRDMSFYDEFPSGKVVSRVTSDTQAFSTVVTLTVTFLGQVGQIVLVAAVLFAVNPRLAAITFAVAPFVVALALGFRAIARSTTTQVRRVQAEVNRTIQESITGIAVAKAFRQEGAVFDSFQQVNARAYVLNVRQGLVFSGIFPLLGILGSMAAASVVWFGGQAVLQGLATPGVVPLRAVHRPVLVPAHGGGIVLEPVPAGAVGERAGVRAD